MSAAFGLYLLLHAIDYRQSVYIQEHPEHCYELNPLIGTHPSRGDVDRYFLATTAGVYLVDKLAPERYKNAVEGIYVTVAFSAVAWNSAIGIGFHF